MPQIIEEQPESVNGFTQNDLIRQEISVDNRIYVCYNTQALRGASKYRGVEQLEARRAHNPEVVGSSPASATIMFDS